MTINQKGFNNLFLRYIKNKYPKHKHKHLMSLPFEQKKKIMNFKTPKNPEKQKKDNKKVIKWNSIKHIWKQYLQDDFELQDFGGGGNCFFYCVENALEIKNLRHIVADYITLETIESIKLFFEGKPEGGFEFIDGLNIIGNCDRFELIKELISLDNPVDFFKKIISSYKPIRYKKFTISYWADEWCVNKCIDIFPELKLFIINLTTKNNLNFGWTPPKNNTTKNLFLLRIPGHYQILFNKEFKKYILDNNEIPENIQMLYLEQFGSN